MYEPPGRKLQDRILVVADDPSVRKTLKRLFEVEGFAVETRSEKRAGLASFYSNPPAATFLDLHLPKLSKQHLCEEMKAASPSIPLIILSASSSLHQKILLLDKGADDYVTKPFNQRELLARLRVALRHSQRKFWENEVTFDGIMVDLEKVEVTRNGTSVVLTSHEFKTLRFLVQNPNRVITRSELLKEVCGYEHGFTPTRTIDNHILKLRQKLENDPHHPAHFRTVRRIGYRFSR